jgi:hypothetical protein
VCATETETFMVVGTLYLGTDSFGGINSLCHGTDSLEKQFLGMKLRFSIIVYKKLDDRSG